MKYINLDRRFRDLTNEERSDPSRLLLREGFLDGFDWAELLQSRCAVILAEAGSGKTRELQEQVIRLKSEGKSAFFIPLEALTGEDLKSYLARQPGDLELFEAWQSDGISTGWIFLDSVDELKLAHGSLDKALSKVVQQVHPALHRTRIILSCRPTDWKPVKDLATLQFRIPTPVSESIQLPKNEEEVFLEAFHDHRERASEATISTPDPRLVVLLPLNEPQIKEYARAAGVANSADFLFEIRRHEAWVFARRPLDLGELAIVWKTHGRLGTRLEQHKADIRASLREDPERRDNGELSADEATEGVERLALALALTGMRTIRVPELAVEGDDGQASLDASSILADWTEAKVAALLRRPIFDPATYGRVRFHHRTIQEFLAAQRLADLRDIGMPARQLDHFLFAESYGEEVVIPSMRPIAAWLALKDNKVLNQLMLREPEVLILEGDPASLPLEVREAIVRRYVSAYCDGDWRSLDQPIAEVRRLANPDLALVIRECWSKPCSNSEVRELLLKLIWLGEITACSDIVKDTALNQDFGDYSRIIAIRGLASCGDTTALNEIKENILKHPDRWTTRVIHAAIGDFFPKVMSVEELGTLIRRIPEPSQTTGGFSWFLYSLAADLDPKATSTTQLREFLTALIHEGQTGASSWHMHVSSFAYLTPTLCRICYRQLNSGIANTALAKSAEIAYRFQGHEILGREDASTLVTAINNLDWPFRHAIFDLGLEITQALNPELHGQQLLYSTLHQSGLRNIIPADQQWLESTIRENDDAKYKEVALYGLLQLWRSSENRDNILKAVKSAVEGNASLCAILERELTPTTQDPAIREFQEERARMKLTRDAEQERIKQSWVSWRAEILNDPHLAFTEDRRRSTLNTLSAWLRQMPENGNSLALANWRSIRVAYGDQIADLAEKALRDHWRITEVPLQSQQSPEVHRQIRNDRVLALTGLLIESSVDPNWAKKLKSTDAKRAIEWATVDLSGFPEWFIALVEIYPTVVEAVLKTELANEITSTEVGAYTHLLSSIRHGSDKIQRVVAPYLREALPNWEWKVDESKGQFPSHLSYILAIIINSDLANTGLADLCEERIHRAPTSSLAIVWLQGLAAIGITRAIKIIRGTIQSLPQKERSSYGTRVFATLFGDRDSSLIPIEITRDTTVLLDLTRLIYEVVRPKDDISHEGVFSPGIRDEAQSARNRILGAIFEAPGPGAYAALLAMTKDPLFAHFSDRIRMRARNRAAIDSEPKPLSSGEFTEFEKKLTNRPSTQNLLFEVMLDRLDDIVHDLQHHDFSDRAIICNEKSESNMQLNIAAKLDGAARGAYRVSREEEVAGFKKPDIRLIATAFDGRAAIEIKIGDTWSVKQLEEAVETQLTDQYLRHKRCSVGCLLVTYAGRKTFKNPITRKNMSFSDVIDHLKSVADTLEKREGQKTRIAVVGIDLRDPLKTKGQ